MEHMNERGTIYEIKRNICHFGCWLEMERIKIRSEHTYICGEKYYIFFERV
jgi:hypothetical protein